MVRWPSAFILCYSIPAIRLKVMPLSVRNGAHEHGQIFPRSRLRGCLCSRSKTDFETSITASHHRSLQPQRMNRFHFVTFSAQGGNEFLRKILIEQDFHAGW